MPVLALIWLAASAPQAEVPSPAASPPAADAPAAADAAPFQVHPGLSVGLGTAYDLLGIRAEVAADHLGLYAGLGGGFVLARNTASAAVWGLSFGGRWYRGVRGGLFVSANFLYAHSSDYVRYDDIQRGTGPTSPSTLFTAGAAVGYRFRSGALYLEAGLGGLVYRQRDAAYADLDGVPCCTPAPKWGVAPDLLLGAGFDL